MDNQEHKPLEPPIPPLASLAARRRPWRAPAVLRAPVPAPPAPTVGERAAGPALADVPPPVLPPPRPRVPIASSSDVSYEVFYGFDEKPFGLASDPRFVYHSSSFDRATQDIVDAIDRHDGITLLVGEKGTGKTTLCLSLPGQIGESGRTSILTGPPPSMDRLLNSLQQSSVVIVDDAERWPDNLLAVVCGLGRDPLPARPQVILVGEPALLARLGRRPLRTIDRKIRTRSRFEPMTQDEVAGFVVHRMAAAGSGVRVEFDEDAIARLHAISGGVPGVVNLVCDRALAEGHRRMASRIDVSIVAFAADALDLTSRPGARPIVQIASILIALVALMLVGAAAAALVFRDDIRRVVIEWEASPAVPPAP